MSAWDSEKFDRRTFLGTAAAALGAIAAPAWAQDNTTQMESDVNGVVRRNISSFRALRWQDHFANTRNGAILVDTTSRDLHFWSEDQTI
jgi:L,D-transpeptidase ErfK/SrfK